MADVAAALPANNAEAATPKKPSKKGAKSTRPKASHPPTAVMVTNAIKNLKERGGSSLQAIKKYISSTYKVDAEKLAPFIKKFIKASVASGSLVQTKGKGASGSFKLSSGVTSKAPSSPSVTKVARRPSKKTSKPRAKSVEKPAVAAKKSPAKKASRAKKAAVAAPKAAAAKPKAAKPRSPAKAKRAAKAPTKKPKSPKPKTTKPKTAAKAKKAAPKKK